MTGFKDYGSGVTESPEELSSGGSFSAEEHSYETIVIQEDKPIIDWEMNLRSDVASSLRQRDTNNKYPTCWIDADFLESPNPSDGGSYSFLSAIIGNENKFRLAASNLVVNGWPVRFEYSGLSIVGNNEITLPAPPVSGQRTDLVILEVWRALISPTPSTDNKSATGLILRHGNVKAPDAVNLTDDLIDGTFGDESAKRAQIQYRFRVISGVDTDGFPDGLDDTTNVFAHTVSDFGGAGADGTVTALNYVKHTSDGGLWIAGTGNAAGVTALGTIDGFMYATPICSVFRRNTTAFDKTTNLNGSTLIASGTSDRPDGFFADQVTSTDIRDMRRGCARDLREVLEKAVQQVFDNTLATHQETVSGVTGSQLFVKDDIGTSSDLGNPDSIRRFYSDRAITESIVVRADIGGLPQASVTFNLSSLRLPWNALTIDVLSNAPAGTNISSITQIRKITPGNTNTDFFTDALLDSIVYSTNISGIDQVTINFTSPVDTSTITRLYVEILVEYPSNSGTSRNIKDFIATWAPPAAFITAPEPNWVDSTLFTATTDANRFLLDTALAYSEPGHREAVLRLQTIDQVVSFITTDVDELMIWERLNGEDISINDGVNPVYTTSAYTTNTSYTTVTLSGASPIAAGSSVTVTYKAYRAAPAVTAAPADSYQFYYRSAAIQSITPPAGTSTLNLIPRLIDQNMYVMTASTGGPDNSFPYFSPGEQVAVGRLPSPDFPEAALDGPAQISTLGFDVDTGFLRLPLVVPYTPNPTQVQLFKDGLDTVEDAEGRGFWPKSQDPADLVQFYSPVLFSVQLSFPQDHKVAVASLMELREDFSSIGRKGSLVLVLFTNWQSFTQENKLEMNSTATSSAAAVYKVTGNMLNAGRNNA